MLKGLFSSRKKKSLVIVAKSSTSRHIRLSPPQIIALVLFILIVIGALLLQLPIAQKTISPVKFLDCLFTATSATCVTGLITRSTADSWTPFGQTVILLLMQIGGLGYMTLATVTALMLGMRLGIRTLLTLRASQGALTLYDTMRISRYVVFGALIIEGIGAISLAFLFHFHHGVKWGLAFFQGIFYAVSAFCNAGFDLAPGFQGLNHPSYRNDMTMLIIIGLLIMLGGIGFAVLADLVRFPKSRRLSLFSKIVLSMTAILVIFGASMFFIFEFQNSHTIAGQPLPQQMITSWFMSVTPRTAGFSTIDLSMASPPTIFLLSMLMFIGASPNSTAGGVKTTTIAIILLAAITMLRQRKDVEIFGRRVGGETIRLATSLLLAYLAAVFIILIAVSLVEITNHPGLSSSEALTRFFHLSFEVVSAFGTVGLSAGITPTLEPLSRILIILAMFLGRLGPLSFILVFTQTKKPALRRLPSEPLMLG